jgi:hypothetical protein
MLEIVSNERRDDFIVIFYEYDLQNNLKIF